MNSSPATSLERARFNMVEQQIRTWEVIDPGVLDVLRTVQREDFVPNRYRKLAFSDLRLPLGHGQVMMKPLEEGRVLQVLELSGDDHVIEVGTGSGFLACCLSRLAHRVTSLEIFEDLAQAARERLREQECGNVEVIVADALQAWQPEQPADALVLTGSIRTLPPQLAGWVRTGGRLFMVGGDSPAMEAVCLKHLGRGEWLTESLFETDLPRLVGAEDPETFEF